MTLRSTRACFAGEEAWVVGGAVRDELLGRELVDLDVACRDPERAARALREALRRRAVPALGAARRLAGRARATAARSTSRRCPGSIEDDLATRDFTINAIAARSRGGEPVDPFDGRPTSSRAGCARSGRASSRTTRCACCGPCGSRTSSSCGSTRRPSGSSSATPSSSRGRRASASSRSCVRLSAGGYRRLDGLGLLEPLGGSDRRPARPLGLARLPPRGGLRRRAPPVAGLERACAASPRALRAGRAARAGRALDPPLPPGDRAVGARGARIPRRVGARARDRARREPTSRPSRCCAATSSTCRPARRSAACSPRSRRSAPRVRSPPGRRRSTYARRHAGAVREDG